MTCPPGDTLTLPSMSLSLRRTITSQAMSRRFQAFKTGRGVA